MDGHKLREQLIMALMIAEDFTYESAERIVAEYERTLTCARCGGFGSVDRHDLGVLTA